MESRIEILEERVRELTLKLESVEKSLSKSLKKPKDPNAPKKPLSAYFLYCSEMREELKSDFPELKFGEIAKKLGEMWKDEDTEVKDDYKKRAEIAREKYKSENGL